MIEQDKTSEARRKAQRNGEEDPVIVAQRFLNIYRQLHIFNAEKKEAFNKMLLELPTEIRGMFGSLPGGAVLQDYVDELTEQTGITQSVLPTSPQQESTDDEVSKAKILATALAEAQVQAAAKIQEKAAVISQPQAPAAAPVMVAAAAPAKLAIDKNFAQELAVALAAAMQKNNAEQKDDIKNIINTLGQTQLEIVKVLQNENNERREDMMTISKMLGESQTKIAEMSSVSSAAVNTSSTPQPKISEETKQLIRMLLDSQQQIAGRLAKVEASAQNTGDNGAIPALIEKSQDNFAKALNVLGERQKSDTLEIAKLINESQQKLVQMMVQHNTLNANSGNAAANNANNIQINTADYAPQLNLIVDKLADIQTANNANLETVVREIVKAQSQLYREVAQQQTKELSQLITLALQESQKLSSQALIEALGSKQIVFNAPLPVYPQDAADPVYTETPEPSMEDTDLQNTNTPVALTEDVLPEETFAEEPASKKKKKKKKKKKNAEPIVSEEVFTETEAPSFMTEDTESSANAMELYDAAIADEVAIEDLSPLQEPDSTEPDFEEEIIPDTATEEVSSSDGTVEAANALPDENNDAEEDELLSNTENLWQNILEDEPSQEETKDTAITTLSLTEDMSNDWGFGTVEDEEEKRTDGSNDESANDGADGVEGEDWEWEYVEDDNETSDKITFHRDNLQPIAAQSLICSGDLYFQQNVYRPASVSGNTNILPADYRVGIKDSANLSEAQDDPYQNSILKD